MGAIRKAGAALAAAAILAGCSVSPTREAMGVKGLEYRTIPATVTVIAKNGQAPEIPILKGAIEDSIATSKLFKAVVQGTGGDYELTVFVWNVHRPAVGISMKVDVELGWTLVRVADKSEVMRKGIKTTYTAHAGEAFAGVERVRIATEGAVRENIKQGLQAIADLKL